MSKKRFEDLDLIDNYLVMAMASDPEAGPVYGRLLAEGLLHQKVRYVRVHAEKIVLGNSTVHRGIRMDVEMQAFDQVPAESDLPDKIYDFEPHHQNRDNLIKRNRFSQAKIDSNNLRSGENDFDRLPDLCVINILDYDPFDRGQMQYHFHNMCEEDTSIPYPDGLDFYYFITKSAEAFTDDTELCALLKYIQNSTQENATTPLTQELHKYVTKIKESAYGRNQYMTWGEYIDEEVEEACKTARKEARAEGLAEGRAEGLAEGRTEGLAEGRTEGLAEGRAEGLAEGRAEGERTSLQNNILTVLSKFGTVSSSTEKSINCCNDTELLKKWFVLAVNAESIQSFEQNIQNH